MPPPVFGECAPRGVWRLVFGLMRMRMLGGQPRRDALKRWRELHGDAPVDAKIRGVKYRLFLHDSFVERAVFRFPWRYEPRELRAVADAVATGGVFLDIGANIGHFALHAARAGAGRVLAFEPNPAVFSRLQTNIALNASGHSPPILLAKKLKPSPSPSAKKPAAPDSHTDTKPTSPAS